MMYYRPQALPMGDPGIFGAIGKVIGNVAKIGINLLPGPVGAIGRTVLGGLGGRARPGGAVLGFAGPSPLQAPAGQHARRGARGAMQRLLPGGETGYIKTRRMNAGNAKAARRAIRRIKSVRHMLQQIEKQLPHRKAAHVCKPFARKR